MTAGSHILELFSYYFILMEKSIVDREACFYHHQTSSAKDTLCNLKGLLEQKQRLKFGFWKKIKITNKAQSKTIALQQL